MSLSCHLTEREGEDMKRVSYIAVCILLLFMGIYLVSAGMNNRTHDSSVNQEQPWQMQTSVQNDQVMEPGVDVSRNVQVANEPESSSGSNTSPPIQNKQSQTQISAQSDQLMKPEMDNTRNEQAVSGRQLVGPEDSLPIQQQQGQTQTTAVSDQLVRPGVDMSGEEQAAQNSNSSVQGEVQGQVLVTATGDQIIRPIAGISWKELVMKQREISKRALAKRYALTIQAVNDSQNENQNGILDEIQNSMQ